MPYDKKDYWKLQAAGVMVTPQMFGCKDYMHNEKGEVDYWVPPKPGVVLELHDMVSIPLEKQHYIEEVDQKEENMRTGWSHQVDQGLINQYWKEKEDWN